MKYELHSFTIDLVICGPDYSGTSTQLGDVIEFFILNKKKVRDIRGDVDAALFHAQIFSDVNTLNHISLDHFLSDIYLSDETKDVFRARLGERKHDTTNVRKLLPPSMEKNDVSTYINPRSADVWIMEEPTYRTAGETCRTFEHNRTKYKSTTNQKSTAVTHSVYREEEFFKFRNFMRENGNTIVRSRSEESACYQIYDDIMKDSQPEKQRCSMEFNLSLPGNETAFANPPTHLFVACTSPDITEEEYLQFKKPRLRNGHEDDLEKDVALQMLTNRRYSTDWLENLYETACAVHGSTPPKIYRFDMMLPKAEIKKQMRAKLAEITGVK